jgi:hypothetical protein
MPKTKTPKDSLIPYFKNIKQQLLQILAEDTLVLEYQKTLGEPDKQLETRLQSNLDLILILNKLIKE